MIYVKNSRGGRVVNMINTLSKIKLSKIGQEGWRSALIWIMSTNILFVFFEVTPKVCSFCNFELRQPKSVHKTAQVRSFLDIENVSIKLLRSAILSTQKSDHRTAKVRSFMDTLKYCHIWQESPSVIAKIVRNKLGLSCAKLRTQLSSELS